MNSIFKLVLAFMAGVALACLVLWLFDTLGSWLYPMLENDNSIKAQSQLAMQLPTGKLVIMLISYSLSACLGAALSAYFAPFGMQLLCGLFTGFFLLLCAIFYFVLIPYPWWFMFSAGAAFVAFSFLGAKLGTSYYTNQANNQSD